MEKRSIGSICILALLVIAGCQSAPKAPPKPTFRVNPIVKPGDPVPHPIYLVQLDVYQISIPFGEVSQNKTFWSGISRGDVDAQTEALLRKNGFRIGQGEIADWPYFKQVLEKNPVHLRTSSMVGYDQEKVPLITRANQPAKNLFYFDSSGQLVGRSFGESDDVLLLSFWPTPRHNGQVHVQLVPMVRSDQSHLRYSTVNGQPDVRSVRSEYLYDLKVQSDIDVGHFLIVAPSVEAQWESSLGNAFLVDNAGGTRTETVLFFVARPIGAHSLLQSHGGK